MKNKNLLNCKVVMLPTEKASRFALDGCDKLHFYQNKDVDSNKNQHLYLVSEKEINKGGCASKAEATTDPDLGLPLIPVSFVKAFVEAKGGIKEVNIETETVGKYGSVLLAKSPHSNETNSDMSIYVDIIKTREDNTVIIHQSKTYTRQEVIDLFRKYHRSRSESLDTSVVDEWTEVNL